MIKKLLIIVLVLIPTCIGIRIASSSKTPASTVQTQQKRQDKKEQSRAVYRGTLNPHADKIPELAAAAKEDLRIVIMIGLPSLTPNAKPFNLKDVLSNRACDADAV